MSSTFRIVPLIPGLVNEVALEIFLHFVAIDRDGPSTLVLVCTAWRDTVLGSKFLQSLRRRRRRPNPALGDNRDKLEEGICIVSFDGGGPGSMSQLRMLEEVMARLAFKKNAEVDELLPADCFDLMGGVGFGGLIALLLGRLRMTTSRAMEELARIGTATFPEGDDMVTPEVNIVRLRKALESMLESNGHSVEIKLRDSSENRCKVVLFAAATEVMDHCHPFRTYRSPRKSLECTFVDVACATMANPEYFSSVSIGPRLRKQNFAGIPHNFHNPMREVLKEAKLVFGEETSVSLMLSLGAGQPARHSGVDHQVTRRSLIHCDGVARDLQDQLHGFAEYLRLNVDKGMDNIELDHWHKLGSIETYTNVYLEMHQITRYIDRAVQLLLQRNGSVTLGNLSGTSADGVVKFHSESLEKYLAMESKQMQDVVRGLGIEKVTLVDAIGNDIPIPKHFCPTYAMLSDVIKLYYRHQRPPGSDLVERGDYRLLHGSGKSILDPVKWDQIEKGGVKVEMSMILRTRNSDKARCPRCHTRSEAPSTNGWATCASCSGQFQIEDQLLEYEVQAGDDSHNEEVRAEKNSIVTPAVRESVETSQGGSPIKGNKKIAKEEELNFRLISVVNLLDTLSVASREVKLSILEVGGPSPTVRFSEDLEAHFRAQPALRKLVLYILSQPWCLLNEEEPPITQSEAVVLFKFLKRTPKSRFEPFFDGNLQCHVVEANGDRCHHVTTRKDRAVGHARAHFGYKPFACAGKCGKQDCFERYTCSSFRNDHVGRKRNPKRPCPICQKLLTALNFKRHMKQHHSGNFANEGRVSALGMSTQQLWSGLQREAANQASIHTQSSFAAQVQQNRSGLNAMNYSTNFTNSTTQQQPAADFNAMQNRPGMNQMANAQPVSNTAIKENFLKWLQTQHVEPRVLIAGRPIDLWDLWYTVRDFDTTPEHPPNHPSKFQIIGTQLGLPTDSQGQIPWVYLKELQEHYNRVSILLQHARNTGVRQTPLPQTNLGANQTSHNTTMLQAALKAYPHIDFVGITQDTITNLPPQRFEARIKQYISERQPANKTQVTGNIPHMWPRTPVPGPAMMNPRIPTPTGPTNNGQMSRQLNMLSLDID